MKITNLVKENIEKYGAEVFYDSIKNCWDEWSDEIQKTILEDIYKEIKPREINTIEDLAKLLNDNICGNELDNPYNIDVKEICKQNKWIVCFPYSDDNFEVRGWLDDELGAYDCEYYKFVKTGDFYQDFDEDNTYHKATCNMIVESDAKECDIEVKWEYNDDYIWYYEVMNKNCPCEYFDIIDDNDDEEDSKTWARCCVIDLSKLYENS